MEQGQEVILNRYRKCTLFVLEYACTKLSGPYSTNDDDSVVGLSLVYARFKHGMPCESKSLGNLLCISEMLI